MTFYVTCKMVGVDVYADVFLFFFQLDLSSEGSIFHMTSINVRVN